MRGLTRLICWRKSTSRLGKGDDTGWRDRSHAGQCPSRLLNFTHSSWITISVIEKSGHPAGWAAREALDENITDFWIDPDYQGLGLGKALLAEIEQEIVRQGFSKASLETHARNREAVDFFEKHGYTVHWLTVAYNPKLDRDVQSVGLSKQLVEEGPKSYGSEF